MKIKVTGICLVLMGLLLGGCLTSESPFYHDQNVVRDPRFVGTYSSNELLVNIRVTDDPAQQKGYMVQVTDKAGSSEFRATLFKLGGNGAAYVDLFPIAESGSMVAFREGYPSVRQLLDSVSFEKTGTSRKGLHVIFKIQMTNNGLVFWGAKKGDDPTNPVCNVTAYRPRKNGEALVVDAPTSELDALLAKVGGEAFQSNGFTLTKTKP